MLPEAELRPPFDPRWLELLADTCGRLAHAHPRLEDLYLERRLELRVVAGEGVRQVETCRTEGAAARWRLPSRTVLFGRSGTSHAAVGELLSEHCDRNPLPAARPVPPAEIDPPRQFHEWALAVAARCPKDRTVVRFLVRQAAVVGPRRWAAARTPPLVHIELDGGRPRALLSVWQQPRLNDWLSELLAPAAERCWRPEAGLRLPVLLGNGTSGVLLHELLGHLSEADVVASGSSPLAPLLGSSITVPTLTVTDDPTRSDLPGGFNADDEGVTAAPQPLLVDGRLEGWLCDAEGARRLGSGGGRGRRASWRVPPVARLSNLVVAAGTADPRAMEGDLTHGLLVTRLGGATVDPMSARALLRVEQGWEIRHGRRRRALAACELTGSVLDVLAHVEPELGADLHQDWRLGWCVKDGLPLPTGSEAPSMLVHRLEVL